MRASGGACKPFESVVKLLQAPAPLGECLPRGPGYWYGCFKICRKHHLIVHAHVQKKAPVSGGLIVFDDLPFNIQRRGRRSAHRPHR